MRITSICGSLCFAIWSLPTLICCLDTCLSRHAVHLYWWFVHEQPRITISMRPQLMQESVLYCKAMACPLMLVRSSLVPKLVPIALRRHACQSCEPQCQAFDPDIYLANPTSWMQLLCNLKCTLSFACFGGSASPHLCYLNCGLHNEPESKLLH